MTDGLPYVFSADERSEGGASDMEWTETGSESDAARQLRDCQHGKGKSRWNARRIGIFRKAFQRTLLNSFLLERGAVNL